MIVKYKENKKHFYISPLNDFKMKKTEYEVYAMIIEKKVFKYLLRIDGDINFYDSSQFEVIDDSIPEFWIFKKYKYNNKIQNNRAKYSYEYMFSIIVDAYFGPRELIEPNDFLFDVYVSNKLSETTLYNTLVKYGRQWRTPPQT